MLQMLRIKNLAIVENIQVEFGQGLNVITGETGAGKSILAAALGLLLGERANRTMIRTGEAKCGVEAEFQLPDPSAVDTILDDLGLPLCEEGQLIIRRIVAASGSGKIAVNDSPTTLQALRKIGDVLVDLHGPHDHQSLLSVNFQMDLLDSFGHLWTIRAAYEELYAKMGELDAQRKELEGDDQQVAQQIDMLSFQVKEIEEAQLESEQEEELVQRHAMASNSQRILELTSAVQDALTENDVSAFNAMGKTQQALSELADIFKDAGSWREEAKSIAVQIQELSSTISQQCSCLDSDPEQLQLLDDRITLLHKLKRKYGTSIEEILSFLADARERLNGLETRGERIVEIEAELKKVREKLLDAGKILHDRRGGCAKTLSKEITSELRALGFEHGVFDISLAEGEPTPSGLDAIEFGFAPNPGEEMRPLRTIASSGEISRVMLAVKAVLATHDRIPVLVFDEIDTNVGGEIGNAIGAKMSAVADNHQVLCITHLPQVAVHGETHLVVAKEVKDGRTRTGIVNVAKKEREEEIARMLGGRDLTSVTLKHAKEMLSR